MRLTPLLFHFYKNLMKGPFTWKPAWVLRYPGNGNGGSCYSSGGTRKGWNGVIDARRGGHYHRAATEGGVGSPWPNCSPGQDGSQGETPASLLPSPAAASHWPNPGMPWHRAGESKVE